MRRVIAHADLDAFFASVELLRDPSLRGKPVIVSGSGPRAVVTTATYEARAFGVHSAMPTVRAFRLCPQAIRIAPDFNAYRTASREVWDIVRSHIDAVEQVGLDEGYMDLSGMVAPKAAMRRLVRDISKQTGLTASVGIGPNKLVAKIASDCEKPAGLVALSREGACERFADASPRMVPGIGPRTSERLAAMGVGTLRQLREVAAETLIEAFGANLGLHLRRRANFEDDGAVTAHRETKSQSSETTFDEDVADRVTQDRVLGELASSLCRRLRERGLSGRTIAIKVRLDDWTTVTRARSLERPTNDEALVTAVSRELLAAYSPPRPVRLLGVRLAAFDEPVPRQAPSGEQLRLAL
jgi:DNA polymerase-4